jgi:hypothetical protein
MLSLELGEMRRGAAAVQPANMAAPAIAVVWMN